MRILGPVFGFVLGSFCTRLFVYPWKEPEGITPTDPRWLGAWWLGMLFISSLLFLTSILIYGFPQTLNRKKAKEIVAAAAAASASKRNKAAAAAAMVVVSNNASSPAPAALAAAAPPGTPGVAPKLSNFPMTLQRLFKNKILMLRTCSSVLHLLPISGLYTFLPKYLESQFRLAAFEANIYTGIAGILVMGIGIFSSGVYIRTREPDAKTVALWVACSALIYAAGMAALMFTGCDQQDFIVDDYR